MLRMCAMQFVGQMRRLQRASAIATQAGLFRDPHDGIAGTELLVERVLRMSQVRQSGGNWQQQ